jgi:hypothetical protein
LNCSAIFAERVLKSSSVFEYAVWEIAAAKVGT